LDAGVPVDGLNGPVTPLWEIIYFMDAVFFNRNACENACAVVRVLLKAGATAGEELYWLISRREEAEYAILEVDLDEPPDNQAGLEATGDYFREQTLRLMGELIAVTDFWDIISRVYAP
jgi:hypothetical protein